MFLQGERTVFLILFYFIVIIFFFFFFLEVKLTFNKNTVLHCFKMKLKKYNNDGKSHKNTVSDQKQTKPGPK